MNPDSSLFSMRREVPGSGEGFDGQYAALLVAVAVEFADEGDQGEGEDRECDEDGAVSAVTVGSTSNGGR
jgi:hypothetical protein